MLQKLILGFLVLVLLTLSLKSVPFVVDKAYSSNEHVLATHSMSLETRYANKYVNDVFKDNILLTLAYTSGTVTNAQQINWDTVRMPSRYELVLNPGEVFAYHDDLLPEYRGKTIKTTHAHFNGQDGFKSDGYLMGDGVCHFASLIHWAAQDAGLKVDSRVNHNFATIPEVPREFGTSIITTVPSSVNAEMQNLYIENTFDKPVTFVFTYDHEELTVAVYK